MNPTKFQEKRHWDQEFERRTKAMPHTRFVAHGEPLPTEGGNVDKLVAFDGSGTWYMFPDEYGLKFSYGETPEDPTTGQVAQGGPLQGMTGRGEKYAGGNVETDVVADSFKAPQAEGQGSQTGGKGIQRAAEGDGAAIVSAIEDPQVGNKPDQHPDQAGTSTGAGEQSAEGNVTEAAQAATDDSATKHGASSTDDGTQGPTGPVTPAGVPSLSNADETAGGANMDNAGATSTDEQPGAGERKGGVTIHRNLTTDTGAADDMKQGEKTATDEAAIGAATASHSTKDLEESSPGTEATDTGEVRDDQGDGTAADTKDPTADSADDLESKTVADLKQHLDEKGVEYASTDLKADLLAKAQDIAAQPGLAIQQSDTAAPTTGGGVMTPVDGVNTDEMKPDADDTKSEDEPK